MVDSGAGAGKEQDEPGAPCGARKQGNAQGRMETCQKDKDSSSCWLNMGHFEHRNKE